MTIVSMAEALRGKTGVFSMLKKPVPEARAAARIMLRQLNVSLMFMVVLLCSVNP
jgi:hypothetical protein